MISFVASRQVVRVVLDRRDLDRLEFFGRQLLGSKRGAPIAAIFALFCFFGSAHADQIENSQGLKPPGVQMEDVATAGSAAGFDTRLPPVIPGEDIVHNGRKMKVWSSSGPVPVGSVPVAPQAPSQQATDAQNFAVIVDSRGQPTKP
jgi:hypothetical protein